MPTASSSAATTASPPEARPRAAICPRSDASPRFGRGRADWRPSISWCCRHPYELLVQPPVAGQLRMEAQRKDVPLPDGHRAAVVCGHDLGGASRFHERRPDEHPGERLAVESGNVQRGLEAVDLPPVAVAPDRDVEQAHAALILHPVRDLLREENHARTCGERGQALRDRSAQRLEQPDPLHQHRHGRALAARKDDAVEPFEISFGLDEARLGAHRLECADMLSKRTLHREDPDDWSCFSPRARTTSLWQRAARPSGWRGSRARASPFPAPRKLPPAPRACRSTWWPRRSPWHASRGPRT